MGSVRGICGGILRPPRPGNLRKGRPLVLQGSTADVGFFILAGLVKLYYPNADGSRVVIALTGPGDVAGFADYVEPNGRHAQAFEAEAVTRVSAALFTRDYVMKALQKLSATQLVAVFERFNTSWSSLACYYTQFLGMSFRDRLQTVFVNLSARFAVSDARGDLLTVELSHDDLAEMIASSRPMVSRLIAEMTDQRIIERQGKHYILLNDTAGAEVAELQKKAAKSFANAAPIGSMLAPRSPAGGPTKQTSRILYAPAIVNAHRKSRSLQWRPSGSAASTAKTTLKI